MPSGPKWRLLAPFPSRHPIQPNHCQGPISHACDSDDSDTLARSHSPLSLTRGCRFILLPLRDDDDEEDDEGLAPAAASAAARRPLLLLIASPAFDRRKGEGLSVSRVDPPVDPSIVCVRASVGSVGARVSSHLSRPFAEDREECANELSKQRLSTPLQKKGESVRDEKAKGSSTFGGHRPLFLGRGVGGL